ncbi:MAG: hypothetical protein B5M52_06495 [Helicobacteraceae bacterium 4484_230]|nr:MAG: hypothetical protein B5M52_06495 [Helicobacteraceae bacterium 4484_230]
MPLKLHLPKECLGVGFDDIRAYVTHKRPTPPVTRHPTSYHFKERSKASFKNDISNYKLHTIIEKTRRIIHARNN